MIDGYRNALCAAVGLLVAVSYAVGDTWISVTLLLILFPWRGMGEYVGQFIIQFSKWTMKYSYLIGEYRKELREDNPDRVEVEI